METIKRKLFSIKQSRAFMSMTLGLFATLTICMGAAGPEWVDVLNQEQTASPIGVASSVVHLLIVLVS